MNFKTRFKVRFLEYKHIGSDQFFIWVSCEGPWGQEFKPSDYVLIQKGSKQKN